MSKALLADLAAAKVYVSIRGDSIRVAPHVYNAEADLARLLSVLKRHSGRSMPRWFRAGTGRLTRGVCLTYKLINR